MPGYIPGPKPSPMRLFAVIAACALAAGCGVVHKIDIQQGNYVTQDLAARLKEGMSRAEVRQLLGTPLLADPFHGDRWDYFFTEARRGRPGDRTLLSVFFENDKVARVSGDARPAAPAATGPSSPAAR
jgi:outer membrane protein assembly factor BamE